MKFSEQWLREWINPNCDTQALAAQLTMAGLEVDAVLPVANEFNHVIVGEIVEAVQHPSADRLRLCKVNIGSGQPLEIVCGAANARRGLKVAVAMIGAALSPEFSIKKTKIRGIESNGMLCSLSELGLAEISEGILELPKDAPVGEDLRKYLGLNDHTFTLKVTPNRGDCLSILGIAREVAALNKMPFKPLPIKLINKKINDKFPIQVKAYKDCPHYVSRVIRNVNSAAVTPLWMQERLRRSGMRSINCIVDIANYVMLELGQPLHVFDLNKLQDHVTVRLAQSGESIFLLDGQEIKLDNQTLIIADAKQPQAIAGVMGGKEAAVEKDTTDILLESAFFMPSTIAHAVQHHHLLTDASHRFQLGVDPELQTKAMQRATELIIQIAKGTAGPVEEFLDQDSLPKQQAIKLRRSRITRILGIVLSDTEIKNILQRLGMKLSNHSEGWLVTPPQYRFDIHLEIDLIEEVARIYGYNQIPSRKMQSELEAVVPAESHIILSRIRNLLVDRGYTEAITYSFVSPQLQTFLDPEHQPKILVNPISTDMAVMRTSLWPGLLQAALYNQHRQESRIRLFETGMCFVETNGKLQQIDKLGCVAVGDVYPEQWGKPKTSIDFFDIKGDVEALLSLTSKQQKFTFQPGTHPALHPTESAQISYEGKVVGYVGALHPSLEQSFKISSPVYLFEVDLSAINNRLIPLFNPISKFPAVRRDIALVLSQQVTAEHIQQKIIENSNELLKNVQIFDVYQGKGIDLGQKSVALGLTFQHPSRTLTDDEVNGLVQKITAVLNREFGAQLRK